MNVPSISESATDTAPAITSNTRLHGRWLLAARVSWIAIALLLLINFLANLPAYYQSSQMVCSQPNPSNCLAGQLTPVYVRLLNQTHLSVGLVALVFTALTLAVSALYCAMGLLIFWRKSQEWMGLFVSLLLFLFGALGIGGFPAPQAPQMVQTVTMGLYLVLWPFLFAFLFTFPTGRFTPRWTWVAWVLVAVLNDLSTTSLTSSLISGILVDLVVLLVAGVQVYRYVRVYDAVQRQQTKWFVFGVGVSLFFMLIGGGLGFLASSGSAAENWYQLFNGPFWLVIFTIQLVTLTIPILRYRLWDIDTLINKALVYGLLTGLLGTLYAGLIIGLESLARLFGRQAASNPVVIVVSTLAIALLFLPVRRRIQAIIDRRFYRKKYDAEHVLADFAARLRQEIDLEQIRESLIAVVQETMQPAHVSLWLRAPERRPRAEASEEAQSSYKEGNH